MQPNEDVPYGNISGFATPDREEPIDKSTLDEIIVKALKNNDAYIEAAIAEHLTIDVIDLNENNKMTPTQQVAVHKLVVHHLRQIREDISQLNSKIKELE